MGGPAAYAQEAPVRLIPNGMDAPTRKGIDVPKWKRYFNHLNREGRPP
jgi:hypothetical protein